MQNKDISEDKGLHFTLDESNPACTHGLYPSSCYPIRSGIMKSCNECNRNMGNTITISKE